MLTFICIGAGYGDVRLSGGLFQQEGRVEIFYNNEWGTICDDLWVWEDAEVVCRQLGYSGVSRLYDRAYFGEGNGSIMKTTGCHGDESYWLQCSYTGWDTRFCYHSEDAGVTCLLGKFCIRRAPSVKVFFENVSKQNKYIIH